jgi:glycerophosphoryl diester phosphodiesterase
VAEIKERQRIPRLIERLAALLAETGALDEVVLISFDHVDLRRAKDIIPGIRTEGITHARHADPVGVARAAGLDSLSIELERFDPEDARALHAAGIALRCHVPPPQQLAHLQHYGIDPLPDLQASLAAGLIDTLSGDDVTFLADLVARSVVRS